MLLSFFLTAYFWLFLGFILSAIVGATVHTAAQDRRPYIEFTLVKVWLEVLLRRGYDGGYLRLGHEPSGQFMQFRKYIRGKGDYSLEILFFGSDWSENTWHKAQAVAEETGFPHRVEALKTTKGSRDGMIIDCGRDTAAAYAIGKSVWTEVFGLTLETPYKAIKGGWSEVDELIDGPDHAPPLDSLPPKEQLKELGARRRKAGEPSLTAIFSSAALMTAGLISGIGFPIAMLLSRGQAPDWSIQLGPASLGGSTASLGFLVVLIVSFWGVRMIKIGKGEKLKKPLEKRLLWLGRVLALGLPFAVVLAWSGF